MEVNGLPLHPLVVHAAVVFGPLAALVGFAHAAVPRWRERLRLPMVGLAVAAALAVVAAYLTGNDLLDSRPELGQLPDVGTHEERARVALWVTLAFAVVAVGTDALRHRTGAVRVLSNVVLALAAAATLAAVVLTADAGARAVWGG